LGDPEKLAGWRDNVRGTASTFIDTALFAAPGVGVPGHVAASVCCGPRLFNLHASVHQSFNFTERWKMQFRADFFNLPNHPAFSNPATNRGRPDFGRVGSTLIGTGGRVTQLALRLEF